MIKIEKITKIFQSKKASVVALNEISLHIKVGAFVLIKGSSGCGKSTLLFTLGGMLTPSLGHLFFEGEDMYQWPEKKRLLYRSRKIGFVYQSYHLIPYLNVLDNILLPNKSGEKVVGKKEIEELAAQMNLQERLTYMPAQLSEGEKQRAALLRALVVKPRLLLADEPTGNLDPTNSAIIMTQFEEYRQQGGTIVMASHGHEADDLADVIVTIEKGKITDIKEIVK